MSDATASPPVLELNGACATIRLNRPKALNALTLEMIRELEAFTHACAKNPHIYGIVMEAEGKGSASAGNEKRDEELRKLGKRIIHLSNRILSDSDGKEAIYQFIILVVELHSALKERQISPTSTRSSHGRGSLLHVQEDGGRTP